MATKTLIRLLIALVALGAVAAILHFAGSGGGVAEVGSSTSKKKVFDDFPINEIAAIAIQAKDASVTLRKGEEAWEVAERDGYRADTEPVVNLLRTIWDLNVVQPVTIGRTQYGRLSLLDPAGKETPADEAATLLSFKDKDGKDLASLWLGKVYERSEGRPDPFGGGMAKTDAGRYLKRGDGNSVYLVGETFSNVQTDPTRWLDKGFFRVEKIKSVEIVTAAKENDWKLERADEAGDFVLANATAEEKLDPNKVSTMKAAFSNPQMEDVFVGDEAKDQKTELATFKIVTFDDFKYEISVGEKNDLNELPLVLKVSAEIPKERKPGEEESDEEKKRLDDEFKAKVEGLEKKLADEKRLEGHIFKVRSYIVDSLIKKRSELMEEKKEEEGAETKTEEVAPGVSLPLPAAPAAPAVSSPAPAPAPEAPKAKGKAPAQGDAKAKGKAKSKGKAKADAPKEPAPSPAAPKAEAPKPAAEAPKEAPKPAAEAPKPE